MQTASLKNPTDWFRVHCFKTLDDPTGKIERREMVVSLDQYPYDFGLGPNPRLPVLSSHWSEKFRQSSRDELPGQGSPTGSFGT